MTSGGDWLQVVPPLRMAEARRGFDEWKREHPAADGLTDDDIRIDLMRTVDGDRVRYMVRADVWQRLTEG